MPLPTRAPGAQDLVKHPLARISHALTAVAIGSLLFLAGCSSSSSVEPPDTGASTSVTSTTVQASTTTSTTLPSRATVGYPSSYDAVQHLLTAWQAGDRAAALQGADAGAVEGMWATPPGELDQRGCAQTYDPALTEGGCILRRGDHTGALQVNTERRDIGWVVSSAIYSPN